MQPWLRITSTLINPAHIVRIESDYRHYSDQGVAVILKEPLDDEPKRTLFYKDGTPEADAVKAYVAWMESSQNRSVGE